ncbi:MAG: AraC family transcriptional regulator [Spirochaetia bacterium]
MIFPVSVAIESLNGGQFVSPGFGSHAVRVIDSYELIFVTQGCLDMFEGERSFHLERNQTLLLFPGVQHGGLLPYAPDVNFYWVHFRPADPGFPDASLYVPKVATVSDPEGLTELFCRFISDQESGILDPLSAAHLVALMLCMTCEEGGQARPSRSRGIRREQESLAQAIHRHIEANYEKPITTSSIARDLHYNPDYLERVFHSRWNMSIIDAVHQKRIGLARAFLHTEPGKNINEIAFECGYTDAGYFRRMFKRLTGLTPREFRTLYARTHINTH